MNRDSINARDSMSGMERRRLKRHPMVSLVWYRLVEESDDGSAIPWEGISKMCDISRSGVGLYTPREMPKGRLVFLEINTNKGPNVSALGRVVNSTKVDDKYFRIGVSLLVVPPNDYLVLKKMLERDG